MVGASFRIDPGDKLLFGLEKRIELGLFSFEKIVAIIVIAWALDTAMDRNPCG
jgi:hypothetical protein